MYLFILLHFVLYHILDFSKRYETILPLITTLQVFHNRDDEILGGGAPIINNQYCLSV